MTNIILCADDYGQNTAISQAIIELLKKNRLSATSCMTNSYYWQSHAKWLKPFSEQIDIGLHFNLTEGKPLTKGFGTDFLPISKLITKAYLGRLDRVAIESELHAQLDEFVTGIGREPDFLDGHQHIQQLPIVREAIIAVYEKRLRKTACYIRSVKNRRAYWKFASSGYLKMLIVQLCGASAFDKALIKNNIPHNSSFDGFYDFNHSKKFSAIFPHFLAKIREKGIIMCHPGLKHSADEDPIADSRYFEYQYFLSDQFESDMAKHSIVLGRFK